MNRKTGLKSSVFFKLVNHVSHRELAIFFSLSETLSDQFCASQSNKSKWTKYQTFKVKLVSETLISTSYEVASTPQPREATTALLICAFLRMSMTDQQKSFLQHFVDKDTGETRFCRKKTFCRRQTRQYVCGLKRRRLGCSIF